MSTVYPTTTLRFDAEFLDGNNQLFDPATVTLKLRDPDGVETSFAYPTEIEKLANGLYRADIDIPAPGVWVWRWIAGGSAKAATEGRVYVKESAFA